MGGRNGRRANPQVADAVPGGQRRPGKIRAAPGSARMQGYAETSSREKIMAFTGEEASYLRSQRLARPATVAPGGQPDVVPVGRPQP
jgi:hypothetical protein